MKQVVLVHENGQNLAAVASKASLKGFLNRTRSSGTSFSVDPEVLEWISNESEVEVIVIADQQSLRAIVEKITKANLCPAVLFCDGKRTEISAVAIGPYRAGLFNSVIGDISKY
jgi:hypothetical protein